MAQVLLKEKRERKRVGRLPGCALATSAASTLSNQAACSAAGLVHSLPCMKSSSWVWAMWLV
jgi:hypothetical protein